MSEELYSKLLSTIDKGLGQEDFQALHWEGDFEAYLRIVAGNPRVVRNAYQRVYDMILFYGDRKSVV